MSKVTFDFSEDGVLGVGAAAGMVTCYPARRRIDGSTIVLRKPFNVPLVKGVGSVDLTPNVPGTAWMITIVPTSNNDRYTAYYVVPQNDSNFKDLTEVDPDTLEAESDPEPAWWAMARSTVSKGAVNADGDLILTRADGVTVNAGHVVGEDGENGKPGGPGAPGIPGAGIGNAIITPDGDLELYRTDGVVFAPGRVVGRDGANGANGVDGADGVDGTNGIDGTNGVDGAVLSGEQYVYTVSEVAGRTVSIWDYINSRQQLIYGDTGWITGTLINGWVGEIQYRRVLNRVTVKFRNMSGSAATSTSFISLPLGYRSLLLRIGTQLGNVGFNASGDMFTAMTIPVDTYWTELSFTTDNVWPVA